MKGKVASRPLFRHLLAAVKITASLAGLISIALGFEYLRFSPPVPPLPSIYRISSGLTQLRFFGTDCKSLEEPHFYKVQFLKSETKCIFTQITWNDPALKDLTELSLHVVYYKSDGGIYAESNDQIALNPTYSNFSIFNGKGRFKPGFWQPDLYHVEVYIEENLIATGEFIVVDR